MIADTRDDIFNIISSWNKVEQIKELTDATKCELRMVNEAEFYYEGIEKANLAIKILQNNNYLVIEVRDDERFLAMNKIVRIKL